VRFTRRRFVGLAAATAGVLVASGGVALASPSPAKGEVDWNSVRKAIAELLDSNLDYDDGSYGPVFVRLAWHAAGTYDKVSKTGGSNGATMRFSPESTDGANAGLDRARKLLEAVKAKFPNASYADLWTLAGVVAVEEMGGPKIPWRPGRSDHVDGSKVPPNGRLPDAAQGQDHVRAVFYRMGFNDQEIVALLGAHTLGRCHVDRSGYHGPWTRAPTTFSNEFFRVLKEEQWAVHSNQIGKKQFANQAKDLMMLPADMALVADPEFKKWVDIYAKDKDRFFADFAKAFSKLLELGVPYDAAAAATATAKGVDGKGEQKPFWKRLFG
jgi:catalase (peroxidase I)